ncbi:MAG TPA: XdhC family protein [Streptosporangiaceae bacterium]|nr:XdhC family protein [Streptosporangiaceae bacterium]
MDGWQVMEQAAALARRGEAVALATVVWRQGPSSGQLGSRAIITASGDVHGWIGGACAEPSVIRQAREVIAEGAPRLLLLGSTGKFGDAIPDGMTVVPISCQSEGALEVYIEPVVPAPHLVVVGRSPMAHALADLGRALGWRAGRLDWTEFTAADAGPQSMVVVATQGHGDEEAVEQAVAAGPAYLGLVGSRKRGAAVLGYLAERGIAQEQLDRVRVPAGLDLGKTSHSEIAVAILAELVQLRAEGKLRTAVAAAAAAGAGGGAKSRAKSGGTRSAKAQADRSAAEPAEAVDPVCGMTVQAGPDGRPLEYEGSTYYFCCAGCRSEFESNPASYARKETRC